MRYLALASDYDGTLARDGAVSEATLSALTRLRQSGRKLILVTGRELPELQTVFPEYEVFDEIVAENGALLFTPANREKRLLATAPPSAFVNDLKQRGVQGISVGEAIVATWHPYEGAVLESIRSLGLDLQVIFNKEAVMILPSGVNKMTGLAHALEHLKLSRHNVVAVGDAQNDLPFLEACECAVAVENALPALKEQVDWVTPSARGEGVAELIDRLIKEDLRSVELAMDHHGVRLGESDNTPVFLAPYAENILLCGQSGGGKSTIVAGVIERLTERSYQTCVIDPEGDYEALEGFVTVGNEDQAPSFEQVMQLLERADSNLVINLIGIKMQDRPKFFASLLTKLQDKFLREGRPHWLVIDEAHHLLPSEWTPAAAEMGDDRPSLLLVTVHPEQVSPAALKLIDVMAVVGKEPAKAVEQFCRTTGTESPSLPEGDMEQGEVFLWFVRSNKVFPRLRAERGKAERKRHKRKYAEGELEPELDFYFRGPESKLNLRVQNLNTFVHMAEGVDDETWQFHLHRCDYSKWVAHAIKDEDLVGALNAVEQDHALEPSESRRRIIQAIRDRYTV